MPRGIGRNLKVRLEFEPGDPGCEFHQTCVRNHGCRPDSGCLGLRNDPCLIGFEMGHTVFKFVEPHIY